MKKYIIISIVILLFVFSWVHIKQQRQFYYVTNDICITIWHDYIILGKYTSFFRPGNKNDYVRIHSRTTSIDICFEDSLNFVMYNSSEKPISFSFQNYYLTKLYQGQRTQCLDFLNYKKIFYADNPYCEIEIRKERGRYVPYVNIFYDSVYVRTAYSYADLLQHEVDTSVYTMDIKNLIVYTEEEIELQNRILKKQ